MKASFVFFAMVSVSSLASFASADQLCGKLNGYCGNGWCDKTITPTFCLNGPVCNDGPSETVIAENEKALNELNQLLDRGEGTYVCAQGARDPQGVFQVVSVTTTDFAE